MIDWSSYRGKLVTPSMLQELGEMSRLLDQIWRKQREFEDGLRREREESVSTEVIPVEIVGTEVRDGVEVHAWREVTTDDATQDGGRSSDGFDDQDPAQADEFAFAATQRMDGQSIVLKHYVATDDGADPIYEERWSLVQHGRSFWGRIKSFDVLVATKPVWKYTIEEVRRDDPDDVTFEAVQDGLDDVEAYNSLESANSATEAYGIDIVQDDGTFHPDCTEEQLTFDAVPVGSVHRVWSETILDGNGDPVTVWTFSAPNPVSGCIDCNGEEEEEE